MNTWRERLAGAGDWQEYRGALRALREGGPAFSKLPGRSREMAERKIRGLRPYGSVATFTTLVDATSGKQPKWDQVEMLVRICAEDQGEPDVEAVVAEWAAAYHRRGGDPGPRFTLTPAGAGPTGETVGRADSGGPLPGAARTSRTVKAASIAALALVLLGLGIWGIGGIGGDGGGGEGKAADKGPLYLTSSWPTFPECDGSTSVAMPAGGPAVNSFQSQDVDFRKNVTAKGGATWGDGHLYLTLSAQEGKTVIVQDIRPSTPRPTPIGPPAWIALTQGGCGDTYGRVFAYDLDKASLVDKGVIGNPVMAEKTAKANPLGSSFTVSAADPATIRVDVTACQGNYAWGLLVDYVYAGRTYREQVGPFRSMGTPGKDTVTYVRDQTTHGYSAANTPPSKAVPCG
ncbi:hypothetical protein OHS33_14575 [Streptomyces sp. NBC_00536]|uniref:hypothetical protein n=1 Tax=Streptomyces sp. NBC_00536 TaxID=2975769 RepID=UPI002E80B6A3|nr:hypothetical protein [Streptomyces sp. NBC_00536]WUC79447.1 hypothetical protein OHS33_14575 [Streptomyces sp. NBC_00536]